MSGASRASPVNSTMSSSPKTAALRRSRARTARARGLSALSISGARSSSSCSVVSTMSGPQPRVDQNVGDVGQQVEHDIDRRGHQDDALHHRIIAVEYGIDDQLAEARNAENLLGQHGAGKQSSEFERTERDDGGERIAHGMLQDDGTLRQSLGAGGAHVVAVQHR